MFKFIKSNETLGVVLFAATFIIAAWANLNVALVIQAPMGITFTAGDFVFPLAYILNDLAAEFFGKKKAILITVSANLTYLFFSATTYAVTFLPGITHDMDSMKEAMRSVFAFSPRVAISSIIALLIGTTLNAYIFNSMKDRGAGFKSRAWVSTLFGEVSDAFFVNWLMFAGILSNNIIWAMIATQIVIKLGMEAFMLPHTHKLANQLHKNMNDATIAK